MIAGAGAGGVAAALQAARSGASVALLEETDWIGGQMTTAGVPTMDEAGFNTDSGLYAEFSERVKVHYAHLGKSVGTCYSSPRKICFEPGVGQTILHEMLDDTRKAVGPGGKRRRLDLYLRHRVVRVFADGQKVTGVATQTGERFGSKILIDATEYGDVLTLTPARYRIAWFTSEDRHPQGCVQDITYTSEIRKYFHGVPPELVMKNPPPGYSAEVVQRFKRDVALAEGEQGHARSFASHNAYRGVPDSANPEDYTRDQPDRITKTGINMANDFPATLDIFDRSKRKQIQCQAKLLTLQFLYYVQHDLGETQWAIANDEGYDTPYNREENLCPEIPEEFKPIERQFPLMPYVRESQRLIGMRTWAAPQLRRSGTPPVGIDKFPTSVGVGDYPMDLHGCDAENNFERDLETKNDQPSFMSALGPFEIPLQVLIPERIDGLMAAEKNISQSRLVNGATRLQPVAMAIGQAAGATAAVAVARGIQPREVTPGAVQRILVDAGCRLIDTDYPDVPKMPRFWTDVQMVTLHGLMSAENGQAFEPYRALTPQAFQRIVDRLSPGLRIPEMKVVSRDMFQSYLRKVTGLEPQIDLSKNTPVSRADAAAALAGMLVQKDLVHAMSYWPAPGQ